VDRDVYLILVGAGISLASSVTTIILQFLLGLLTDRIREQRAEKARRASEIRAALTNPRRVRFEINPRHGSIYMRASRLNFKYFLPSLIIGIVVFGVWIIWVFIR